MAITEDGGFGPVPEPFNAGDCSTELLVIAPDRGAVTRALRRVYTRLGHVLYDGREVDDPHEPVYSGANLYTAAPYEPEQFVRGVTIGVDFKSEDLSAEMGATYREIVKEELRRDGVTDASLALPDTSDRETIGEAMFASSGVESLKYRVELGPLLDAVLDHAPEGALVAWDAQFASPPMRAFLERYGRRDAPLAYLSDAPMIPLNAESTAAFRLAAAAQDPVIRAPLWVVHDDHVLALAWSSYGAWVRVRADADPRLIEALAALHRERARPTGPHVARIEWAADRAARAHLATAPVPPAPHADWWDRAWRSSEPLPPLPAEPPTPFDRRDAAVRLNASVIRETGHPPRWRWHRPLFGPKLTAEEGAAWLHLLGHHDDISSPLTVALEMTRYVPGVLGFGKACDASGGERLPAAARLTALVAIGGAEQTLDWLLGIKPDPANPRAVAYSRQGRLARGVRAGLLPHLDAAARAQLAERVVARRNATPWTEGPAPTIEHLLVGVEGADAREAPVWE